MIGTIMLLYDDQEWPPPELAKEYGIKPSIFHKRLQRGLSIDEAIAMGPCLRYTKYCYHDQMLTIREIVRISGTPEGTIRHRLHRGWTIEEAADLPVGSNKSKPGGCPALPISVLPKDISPTERSRYLAAIKIFRKIGVDPIEWNFRCTVPMVEFVFESDLLLWTIQFTPDGRRAELSAFWKEKQFKSDFCRVYKVSGDEVQEEALRK